MNRELSVYNTLTRKKEIFRPINPPFVGMYVCGPTVYSNVHLGNARTFISFDMMFRYLQHIGYQVRYVRNITDAGHLENDADEGEDKISKKARLEQLEPMEIVQRYTLDFHNVMDSFNALPPSIEPTATGHIVEQIALIRKILEKELAYEVNGSVYFDVPAYIKAGHSYGLLSGRGEDLDNLLSGSRDDLDGQSEKRDPRDFALWKNASPTHIMRWESPWGIGFPGWHLECSVMSTKYLGDTFDIHGGGMDLKFPHHECEVAQCTAGHGHEAVRYWIHTNMLTVNGARMGKSKGNSFLPHELFSGNHPLLDKGYSPMVVRFFMMQAHYASTLDFSNNALQSAEKGYDRLMEGIKTLDNLTAGKAGDFDVADLKERCYNAMNDDFNTPVLIAHLFDGIRYINSVKDGKASIDVKSLEILKSLYSDFTYDILGLKDERTSQAAENGLVDGLMDMILDIRQNAKAQKDWPTADKIRDGLGQMKIVVKDSKEGSTWSIGD